MIDAVKLGIIVRNVVDAVEPPRTTKYEAQILGWEEVHAFLGQITDPLHQTLALLAIQTGLRRSEILGCVGETLIFPPAPCPCAGH